MRLLCVVDDAVERSSPFWGEHGLAFIIEAEGNRVLFDTGQSGTLLLRDLLACWVAGEIDLSVQERTRDRLIALARDARGMWSDRDPDTLLAASRARLRERDQELTDARLDA
jgi:hypothetical protein